MLKLPNRDKRSSLFHRSDKEKKFFNIDLRYLEILDLTENEISKIEAGDFRGL
jgi:hypothetical protein